MNILTAYNIFDKPYDNSVQFMCFTNFPNYLPVQQIQLMTKKIIESIDILVNEDSLENKNIIFFIGYGNIGNGSYRAYHMKDTFHYLIE